MDEREPLESVAEKYRKDGYEVLIHPSASELPAFLESAEVEILARKGDHIVAIRVNEQSDEDGPEESSVRVATHPDADHVASLLDEAQLLLTPETMRAALVIAWSALEA